MGRVDGYWLDIWLYRRRMIFLLSTSLVAALLFECLLIPCGRT